MSNQVSNTALRQHKKDAIQVKVALLGLNRVTASLGLALHEYSNRPNSAVLFTVLGRDDDNDTMRLAQQKGAIDNFNKNYAQVVGDADMIFLNTPMGQHEEVFARLGETLKPGAVVIDLSPLKQPGVALAKRFFPRDMHDKPTAYLVGATPLVGYDALYTVDNSVENAKEFLFRNSDILIAPDATVPSEAVKVVTDIADFLNMTPRFMDPGEHDALTGITEGMPALLALALMSVIARSPSKSDFLRAANFNFGGSVHSLHDLTPQDLAMMTQPNRVSLRQHLDQVIATLENIKQMLVDSDEMIFPTYASGVLDAMGEWEVRREKNHWDYDTGSADVRTVQPGFGIGQMFVPKFRRKDKQDEE
ncbi:MAG: prephenate dehydrogenase/arogenate dehydrogenase family protein [Anaerolineae bacterium]|nr:prephenate dehydrogenase/arogenate dehydrogenase family protein [Anaerolineae bacterium]